MNKLIITAIISILLGYQYITPSERRKEKTPLEQLSEFKNSNVIFFADYRHRWDITEHSSTRIRMSNPYIFEQINMITLDADRDLISVFYPNFNNPIEVDLTFHDTSSNADPIEKTKYVPMETSIYHIVNKYKETDSTESFNVLSRKGRKYQVEFDYRNLYVIFRYLCEDGDEKPFKAIYDAINVTVFKE